MAHALFCFCPASIILFSDIPQSSIMSHPGRHNSSSAQRNNNNKRSLTEHFQNGQKPLNYPVPLLDPLCRRDYEPSPPFVVFPPFHPTQPEIYPQHLPRGNCPVPIIHCPKMVFPNPAFAIDPNDHIDPEIRKTAMVEMESQLQIYLANLVKAPSSIQQLDDCSSAVVCLNNLACYWIDQQAARRGYVLPSSKSRTFVLPFGSYGLGLSAGRDLDVVLVAPLFVKREEFFGSFVQLLKQQPESVRDVCAVENAFVPVVKFVWHGVEVDLTFAALGTDKVPEDERLLLSDDVLIGMDEKSIRSFNGWRVCRFLLDYVPNVKLFQSLLMLVKHWAIRRQIYSNSCGYLGGVSWAILVAKLCRMHLPSLTLLTEYLQAFMKVFSHWNWGLVAVQLHEDDRGGFDFRSVEEEQLMRIYTPCYPQQNSSFNVTRRTSFVIQREMVGAWAVISGAPIEQFHWDMFFQPLEPWCEYSNYLILTASAPSETALKRWRGCVESRLHHKLLCPLGMIGGMNSCQIYPNPHLHRPSQNGQVQYKWAIGVDMRCNVSSHMSQVFKDFKTQVKQLAYTKEEQKQLHQCTIYLELVGRNEVQAILIPSKTLESATNALSLPSSFC